MDEQHHGLIGLASRLLEPINQASIVDSVPLEVDNSSISVVFRKKFTPNCNEAVWFGHKPNHTF